MIDADIYGPSQPTLLDAHARPVAEKKTLIPVVAPSGVKLLSVGQLVPAGQALAWRGPMASGALAQLIDGDWGDTEILLVDLPPGTGDVQLSLVQKAHPDGAVIVSTPQDLALIDARRAIDLFGKTGVPVLGLIENMAGYVCPHCGETSDPFGSGGAEASARDLGIAFLGRLPLSASLRIASDAGTPPAGDGPPYQSVRQAFICSISFACASMISSARVLSTSLAPLSSSARAIRMAPWWCGIIMSMNARSKGDAVFSEPVSMSMPIISMGTASFSALTSSFSRAALASFISPISRLWLAMISSARVLISGRWPRCWAILAMSTAEEWWGTMSPTKARSVPLPASLPPQALRASAPTTARAATSGRLKGRVEVM